METIRARSAGGIVLGNGGTIALVQSRRSKYWTFPKGHVDEGETDEEAARREIMEEAGLVDLEYLGDLGEYQRPRMMPDGQEDYSEVKVIRMFLFAAPIGAVLAPTMEMQDAAWVTVREIADRITIPKDRVWLSSVMPRILEAIRRD